MPKSRSSLPATVALSMILLAGACAEERPAVSPGGQGQGTAEAEGEETSDEGTVMIAGEEATNHGAEDVTGLSELELEVDDYYFEPTVLEGEAGQSLSVSLHNEGAVAHTFTIDGQEVDVQLSGGASGQADLTFPESGALVFYCTFHRSSGMLGGLSVGGELSAASGGSGGGGGSGGSPSGPGYYP